MPYSGVLELLTDAIAAAPVRCSYAEARHVATDDESILVRNGHVAQVDSDSTAGIGVRVRVGGGWGFAATREVTATGVRDALARALTIAESQPTAPAGPLAPVPPARGHWSSGFERDPFEVSLDDKLELLLTAEARVRGDPRIVRSEAECTSRRVRTAFVSTDGAACTQERVETGATISAIALDGDELQVRSYPGSHESATACGGWERVVAFDLAAHGPRVAAEAIELLTAPPCPAGRATLVLGREQLALQIHESIGHALELDRMLLGEAAYAGTSWVAPDDLGTLRYGSSTSTSPPTRRSRAAWARSAGTTRGWRACERRSSSPGSCARRCRTASRPRRSACRSRAAAPAPTASRASRWYG